MFRLAIAALLSVMLAAPLAAQEASDAPPPPDRSATGGYKDAYKDTYKNRRKGGLGLGFFIAKTLLEATGARIRIENRQWGASIRQRGASVTAAWPVSAVEAEPIT